MFAALETVRGREGRRRHVYLPPEEQKKVGLGAQVAPQLPPYEGRELGRRHRPSAAAASRAAAQPLTTARAGGDKTLGGRRSEEAPPFCAAHLAVATPQTAQRAPAVRRLDESFKLLVATRAATEAARDARKRFRRLSRCLQSPHG